MSSLQGKTLLITGGSRGIGLAIGLKAAAQGANIVIAAKTTEAHPKLPGFDLWQRNRTSGRTSVTPANGYTRQAQIEQTVAKTIEQFGGLDILVNNASAISLTDTLNTTMKRFDLMQQVNARGTFAMSQAYLRTY